MTFYDEWELARENGNDRYYIESFLSKSEESLEVFNNGTPEELVVALNLLMKLNIKEFLEVIDGDYEFSSRDIVQYSNFEHAIKNICIILKYDVKTISFIELGERLYHSESDMAKRKYGENHAKLAEEFSLVKINGKSNCRIENTAFGDFSIALSKEELSVILQRMGLRNSLNKELISKAKEGITEYRDVVGKVIKSESTIQRRKTNVKKLLLFCIGKDNEIIENLIW